MVVFVALLIVASWSTVSDGAVPCNGDCDSSGLLTAADVDLLVNAAFDDAVCPLDVTGDASLGAADVVALIADIALAACWLPLPPLPEGPRQEHAVAALDGIVYVVGGFVGASPFTVPTDLVEVYDPAAATWGAAAPLPIEVHHVVLAVADGKLYSLGGLAEFGFVPIDNLYEYDPAEDEWTRRADLPVPRGAGGAATIDGLIYVVGGSEDDDPSTARHEAYNPATNDWMELAPLPSGRDHLGVAAIGGKLYAVGGRDRLVNTTELDRYDPATNQWEILPPMPTARGGLAVAVVHERLVVVGGEYFTPQSGVFPQVEIYDPATNEWTSLAPMPMPRHGMGAAAVGDLIYVPGGGTRAGFRPTDFVDALQISLSHVQSPLGQ